MSRDTTAGFNSALDQTSTATGYLVQLELPGSPTVSLRWSDLGALSYDGQSWSEQDMTVGGYGATIEGFGSKEMTLEVQNLDSAIIALLLGSTVYDMPVTIWQMARGIGSPDAAPKLARMVVDGAEMGFAFVKLKLLPIAQRYAFAPFRKVDAANGLANATPEGTRIPWGNELFILETYRG